MRKSFKVVLIVLLILCVLCVALGIWQRENIAALVDGIRYTEEDISSMITENDKIISDAIKNYPDMDVRDVGEEERKAFEAGEISEDELVQIVLGQTSLDDVKAEKNDNPQTSNPEKSEPQNPAEQKPDTGSQQTQSASNGDSEIAALVAKVYVLKSTYVSKLEGLIAEAKSEFIALPEEKRNAASKQSILSSKLSRAAAMEADCNGQIEAILSELTTVLKKYVKDGSLVDSIRTAYANEKQLKKSYYISKYLN